MVLKLILCHFYGSWSRCCLRCSTHWSRSLLFRWVWVSIHNPVYFIVQVERLLVVFESTVNFVDLLCECFNLLLEIALGVFICLPSQMCLMNCKYCLFSLCFFFALFCWLSDWIYLFCFIGLDCVGSFGNFLVHFFTSLFFVDVVFSLIVIRISVFLNGTAFVQFLECILKRELMDCVSHVFQFFWGGTINGLLNLL